MLLFIYESFMDVMVDLKGLFYGVFGFFRDMEKVCLKLMEIICWSVLRVFIIYLYYSF